MPEVTKTLPASIMRLSQFTGAAQVISPYPNSAPPQKKTIQKIYIQMQPTVNGDLKDSEEMKNTVFNCFRDSICLIFWALEITLQKLPAGCILHELYDSPRLNSRIKVGRFHSFIGHEGP